MSRPALAIIAALPREIRGLVGRAVADPALKRRGIHLYRVPEGVVVAAGTGQRVALAFEAALEAARTSGGVGEIVSTGLAGACGAGLVAGDVAEAGIVIDAQTGERFRTAGRAERVLVSAPAIAGVREKARLAAAYGAAIVDMEAATLARLALAHGIPFRALKGISDAEDVDLSGLGRFADERGQFRTAAFALHTALRPGQWRAAMKLGADSSRALAALHARLRALAAEPR